MASVIKIKILVVINTYDCSAPCVRFKEKEELSIRMKGSSQVATCAIPKDSNCVTVVVGNCRDIVCLKANISLEQEKSII